MKIRNITVEDYERLGDVVNEWGNRSSVYNIVPKLFFEHFQETSFLMEHHDETVAILIGFISQTNDKQAYVHFIGVNPNYRQQGIARQMYKHFFEAVNEKGCHEVCSITAPINRASIAFHESLGFTAKRQENYNGPGEDRITFSISLHNYK